MRRPVVAALLLGCLPSTVHAADISVVVENVSGKEGSLVLCLWDGEKGFPNCEKGKPVARQVVPTASAAAVFRNVAPGTYAVSAFHDINGNGVLDSNFIGLPKEPVGMSNNPKIMGPPRFAPASFAVTDTAEIRIRLQGM